MLSHCKNLQLQRFVIDWGYLQQNAGRSRQHTHTPGMLLCGPAHNRQPSPSQSCNFKTVPSSKQLHLALHLQAAQSRSAMTHTLHMHTRMHAHINATPKSQTHASDHIPMRMYAYT